MVSDGTMVKLGTFTNSVLILILIEHGLGHDNIREIVTDQAVLILIVMEHGLGLQPQVWQ